MDEYLKQPSILRGAGAGFLVSFAGLVVTYLYLCGYVGATTQGDVSVIFLAAVTYIPLMMIFVFFLPNALLGVSVGLAIGVIAKLRGATPRIPIGLLIGVILSNIVFRTLVPLVFQHKPGDNDITVMISPIPFVLIYGAFLGGSVWMLYRKMSS